MKFEVRNGCFSYQRDIPVLKNISFSVESGQILSVLGPNGVGKTTLLRNMMGMLHWTDGGSFLDGENIALMSPGTLWKRIAYVPQAKGVTFSYTVEEMILLGRSAHIGLFGTPGREDRRCCEEAMEAVGITHMRDRLCGRISGGELQMVLIARALCGKPELLVLDEPESNLDFRNQLIILETIERLSRKDGLCCIFNTHYPEHALRVSDRSLLLSRDGTSIFGASEEVIEPETMRKVFQVDVDIRKGIHGGKTFYSVTALSLAGTAHDRERIQ